MFSIIKVFYSDINDINISSSIIDDLNNADKKKIEKLNNLHYKQFLAGRYLLKYAIDSLNLELKLKDIKRSKEGKPFFDNKIPFSISHSNNIVCCAISDDISLKLGIDTQVIQQINHCNHKNFFTDQELAITEKCNRSLLDFWTTKESILKACSSNIFIMKRINVANPVITFKNIQWHIYDLKISKKNITKIAINKSCKIKIIQVYEKSY